MTKCFHGLLLCLLYSLVELFNKYPQTVFVLQMTEGLCTCDSLMTLCKVIAQIIYTLCYVGSSVDAIILIHTNQLMYVRVLTT